MNFNAPVPLTNEEGKALDGCSVQFFNPCPSCGGPGVWNGCDCDCLLCGVRFKRAMKNRLKTRFARSRPRRMSKMTSNA